MPVVAALLFALLTLVARQAAAQIQASERGTISQEVDGTKIALDYGRPQLRGRTPFPDVVKWGEVWTPGANWATTLEVSRTVRLDGHEVKAGKYGVWLVPGEKEWTLYLHAQAHRFHTMPPKPAEMLLTIAKAPVVAPTFEILTFQFSQVARAGATLEFHWGTVALPFRIDVEPSLAPATMTAAEAAPYVGKYTMIIYGEKHDSTTEAVEVVLKDGRLHGVPVTTPDLEFVVVPSTTKRGVLYPAFLDKGAIAEIEVNTPLTWRFKGERAVQFTVVDVEPGRLWFKGVRK